MGNEDAGEHSSSKSLESAVEDRYLCKCDRSERIIDQDSSPEDRNTIPSTKPCVCSPCSSAVVNECSCIDNSTSANVGVPLPGLSIDTYGSEVAGSGYGWLTAPDTPEPYHAAASVLRAQQIGLNMIEERIQWTKKQIELIRNDEQMIADFVAETFEEELHAASYHDLLEDVRCLENEIDQLRRLSPESVPPLSPGVSDRQPMWYCVRCLEGNPTSSYRCRCSFPRVAIDPQEAARCVCMYCTQGARNFDDGVRIAERWPSRRWLALIILHSRKIGPSTGQVYRSRGEAIAPRGMRQHYMRHNRFAALRYNWSAEGPSFFEWSISAFSQMQTVVDQLVDMGFDRTRAQYAFTQTGSGTLEMVMDWLISHEDEDIPAVDEKSTEANATNASSDGGATTASTQESKPSESSPENADTVAHSYKCNDCGKLFRDESTMMFHAAKSGHENFSESAERVAALTPEEIAKKAAELRDRIRAARALKEEQERKEEIEKERRRREEGKKMLETREKQRENELRAIAEERKRAKAEEAAARQRVLDQIKLDKEARRAKAAGETLLTTASKPSSAPAPAVSNKPKTDYKEAMIQVRLPSGQAVRQSFGASEPLSAVRLWLELNHSDGTPFSLLMPFPRKVMTEEDYEKPLKELGLVPSASLTMTP